MKFEQSDLGRLDEIIVGRVEPHIYAFRTNSIPDYLKIGDTQRPISTRLNEWRAAYPDLEYEFDAKAKINDDVYFRDYAVHQYLERDLKKERFTKDEADLKNVIFSNEFFKDTSPFDIALAVEDIVLQYDNQPSRYSYYEIKTGKQYGYKYNRGPEWILRPNQLEAVNNFVQAVDSGRKNLLMYAVMRFGKSFTSLYCAKSLNAKLVFIVSAKADVAEEWKKTTETAGNFKGFTFLTSKELLNNSNAIEEAQLNNGTAVVFLTLQDLLGDEIKEKHKSVFSKEASLLIIDETHFGARAEKFGQVLQTEMFNLQEQNLKEELKKNKQNLKVISRVSKQDNDVDIEIANEVLNKTLKADVKLHLSGTPYRVLMGNEFEKEDIISFVQFSDIVSDQKKWDHENLQKVGQEEWDNPYFGFPQMVRFAFNPNESSRKKLNQLRESGEAYGLSALLEPKSITKDSKGAHTQFKHEKEVLDLLNVIDGSRQDDEILGFLDYDRIKEGEMCRHIVMVLPYCASCDAMETLIKNHKDQFKNLHEYKIINISGVDGGRNYPSPKIVQDAIKEAETNNQKTITLTVNRMLTGSTVEEWDTMLFLKGTSSPQEYDQAIFRLQNQYVRELENHKGEVMRENLKPQTLLVDFDPNRMFQMQEQKSLIYNVNTDEFGNKHLEQRIEKELQISPIITINSGRIQEVQASDILVAIAEYNINRSIDDEVRDIPVDLKLFNDEYIRSVIDIQAEIGTKDGLTLNPVEGSEVDLGIPERDAPDKKGGEDPSGDDGKLKTTSTEEEIKKEKESFNKKFRTYYKRLLFFAFLSDTKVSSLSEIIDAVEIGENRRLAQNIEIERDFLVDLFKKIDPFMLSSMDYKIQNISTLANDENLEPLDRAMRAMNKFSRISDSEVRTPEWLCDEMIKALPGEQLKNETLKGRAFLDIASKSGEFAVAAYKRLTNELGIPSSQVKNSIFSIPTSKIAYEFTRKFYEILDLNVENITSIFNSYDLLPTSKGNAKDNSFTEAKRIETWDYISTDTKREERKTVKFGTVVGNPPYQIKPEGGTRDLPIYQHFVSIGKALEPKFLSFVIQSRWMTGGLGLTKFRKEMLNDSRIKSLVDFPNSDDVFEGTGFRGGVCHFLWDSSYSGTCQVTSVRGQEKFGPIERKLNEHDVFVRDARAIPVLRKVLSKEEKSINTILSVDKEFGWTSNFDDFSHKKTSGAVPLHYVRNNKRLIGYISREKVTKSSELIDTAKVLVPKAGSGAGVTPDYVLSTPMVVDAPSTCTQTFLFFYVSTILEARYLKKYLESKFVRFLISLRKITQDATRATYTWVPVQSWDRTWTDKDLYEKYDITQEEQEFIESQIKEVTW